MEELKKRIHDDSNGLDYVLVGDYYLPDLNCRRKIARLDVGGGCTWPTYRNIAPAFTERCF